MNSGGARLELGKAPGRLARAEGTNGRWLLVLVAVLQIALLVLVFLGSPSRGPAGSAEDVETLRAVALDLESRGLLKEAARQWEACLEADPGAPDSAQILYRTGNHYLKARDFEKAAAAFVRAERAPGCDAELKRKIGPKMVECLRGAGLYGEVGRELARRTTASGEGDEGRVLATFDGEPFTESDLDRLIEFRVDRLLGIQGGAGSGERRAELLRQMSEPGTRRQIFMEVLRTELLCRRARELKLDETDEYRDALGLAEQELLAAMVYEQELGEVAAAPVDVEAFFGANSNDYRDEETGEVPDFESVRDRVAADYVARKRKEIADKLMNDLIARYDVRIMETPESPVGVDGSMDAPPAPDGSSGGDEEADKAGDSGKEGAAP